MPNNSNSNSNGASLAAQSLMHQTDANGNQQRAMPPQQNSLQHPQRKRRGSVFSSLCCCFNATDVNDIHSGKGSPYQGKGGLYNLLGPIAEKNIGKQCIVLDLDETLVHSSFKPVPNPDCIIPVEIESIVHHVYVRKRPGVDKFLKRCGELFEIVVYTASLSKYADPLLDKLDIQRCWSPPFQTALCFLQWTLCERFVYLEENWKNLYFRQFPNVLLVPTG